MGIRDEHQRKIDLLMRLTKTTNSSMARFTAMDPSHLSRLRRGERSVAPGAPYLGRMAIYFARHCREEYQIRTLAELVKISPERMDAPELLADAIENWLYQEEQHGGLAVEKFLEGISQRPAALPPDLAGGSEVVREEECWCYTDKDSCRPLYGNHGKREAVLCFLERILSSASPTEVLLFSDEDMDWMTEDRRFMMEWAGLMMKIGLAGHQITMIHTINRNLDEMLTAIGQWMPLYMTGAIKPYYFPKKRDGILKRTLFIATGIGAVTSSSVIRPQPEQMILYLTDEQGVRSVREEFNQYFSLCRPLMKIFTEKDYQAHLDVLTEFEGEEANSLIRTASLWAVTMPEGVRSRCWAGWVPKILRPSKRNWRSGRGDSSPIWRKSTARKSFDWPNRKRFCLAGLRFLSAICSGWEIFITPGRSTSGTCNMSFS